MYAPGSLPSPPGAGSSQTRHGSATGRSDGTHTAPVGTSIAPDRIFRVIVASGRNSPTRGPGLSGDGTFGSVCSTTRRIRPTYTCENTCFPDVWNASSGDTGYSCLNTSSFESHLSTIVFRRQLSCSGVQP
jgi:hypothetical protein